MQLSAKRSEYKREAKMPSLFNNLITRYAQEVVPQDDQPIDPNQLQVGQQVYDSEGKPQTVVQNEQGELVTIPADQAGQTVPQGVKTLQPTELVDYSLNPPNDLVQARIAQEESGIDWEELMSISLECATYAQAEKDRAFFDALDRLNTAALSYVQMPTDISHKDLMASLRQELSLGQKRAQEFDYLQSIKEVSLEAIEAVLGDIAHEAYTQPPGFLEAALEAFQDRLENEFIQDLIPDVESLVEQAFRAFLSHFQALADAGESPSDPNEIKLMEYYQDFLDPSI